MYCRQWNHGVALLLFGLLTQAAVADQVDNPAYQAWAAYKPGATATFKMTSPRFTSISVEADGNMAEKPLDMTRTESLVEILPDLAVISITTTLQNGRAVKTVTSVSARIEKNFVGIPAEAQTSVAAEFSDAKERKETLQIKAKPMETTMHSVTVSVTTNGKTTISQIDTWKSADVPGGLVKMNLTTNEKKGVPRTDLLIDYTKPAIATSRPPEELDDRTPLGLMRMLDRGLLIKGGMEKSISLFHFDTAKGKEFAEASAASNLAITFLEKAARDRFGASTGLPESIDHVLGLGGCSRAEIESASVEITGNEATVLWGDNLAGPMTRVGGRWRFDAEAFIGPMDQAAAAQLVRSLKDATALANRFTKELADGKYKTEEEFKKAMIADMDKNAPPR